MNKNVQNPPILGNKAPSFYAITTNGNFNFPDDFKGKWVIFFSHPADFTPVCTTEIASFAALQNEFKELNTEIIGLSIENNSTSYKLCSSNLFLILFAKNSVLYVPVK